MKNVIRALVIFLLVLIMSGCSKEKSTKDWITEDIAGIENPGFTIVSKEETSNYISFVLEDIDIDMVNGFIDEFNLIMNKPLQ